MFFFFFSLVDFTCLLIVLRNFSNRVYVHVRSINQGYDKIPSDKMDYLN